MRHERTRRIGYFILTRIKRASQLSIYSQFVKTARCNQKIFGWFYRSRNNVCHGWGMRRYSSFLGLGYCMGCSFESSCGDIDKFGPFNHLKDFSSSFRNSSNLKKVRESELLQITLALSLSVPKTSFWSPAQAALIWNKTVVNCHLLIELTPRSATGGYFLLH